MQPGERAATSGFIPLPLHLEERWGDRQQLQPAGHPNPAGPPLPGWKTTYPSGTIKLLYSGMLLNSKMCYLYVFDLPHLFQTNVKKNDVLGTFSSRGYFISVRSFLACNLSG